MISDWKTKVICFALPFKIVSATIGALSYCWQMNVSHWLFLKNRHMIPFNWELLSYFPTPGIVIGGLMGYISAVVLILWCQQYYRTAHFVASAASSWCVGLGVVFISLILFGSNQPFFETLLETTQLLFQFGMPFFWGLILQVCARRLKRLPWRIET